MTNTATVQIPCPNCGATIERNIEAFPVYANSTDSWDVRLKGVEGKEPGQRVHHCAPAEPRYFGARVLVTRPDGTQEHWLNVQDHPQGRYGWMTWDIPGAPGGSSWKNWDEIYVRGTVTIGWDE